MVGIVDYGAGNLRSVQKALEAIGERALIAGDAAALDGCERLILPGVGAFGDAAAKLEPGEISGLVESSYGLHILLREPVKAEDLVLMQTAQPFTLRYTAAVMDYNNLYNSAIMGAEVVYAEGFEGFRPADLFAA